MMNSAKLFHKNPSRLFLELRKQMICILILLVHISAGAQTLEEYLSMATDSNPGLKAKFLSYMAALEKVPQTAALPDPEVSFGYFVSPIETRVGAQEARFSAMQMFPWFGTLGAKKSVSVEIAKAKYDLFEQSRMDLIYQVKETYYALYELEKSTQITKRNLEILETYETLATTKFETGTGSMVDVLRIQMEIAELENSLLLFEDKHVPLTTAFNQYLNRDPNIKVVLSDTMEVIELMLNKKSLNDSILLQNEQLKSIDHMQKASEYSEKVAKKMGAPSLGLGLNYVIVSERTDVNVPNNGQDAFMPLISLKIPIYRRKYKAMKREASLNQQTWKNMGIEQRNLLQTQLEMAWVEYSDAGRRISLYQHQSETADQTQDILIEAYGTDGKDFEEILRVQRMLLQYELKIIKAMKDKNTAVAKIETLY